MSVAAPQPVSFNPWWRLAHDLWLEREWKEPLPPGAPDFSIRRTHRFSYDPLPILFEQYRRHGPVFTLRLLHARGVFLLGPEANHHMLVSHAENFRWRDGGFVDLIPLLGDGLLTIDGGYHRRARRIMLPAFHRDRIAAAQEVMATETLRALEDWRDGEELPLYHRTRALTLRVAMRALFGFDSDGATDGLDPAAEFERALNWYGRDFFLRTLRGPFTPWRRMHRARRRLDRLLYAEIARRRTREEPGEDILSLLIAARDEDGSGFTDREVRDQVMTLLFAGHDTTTSTVAFLFHELAGHPEALERLLDEQERVLGGRVPTGAELTGEALPELEMAIDETLRLYPPAWIGPRRCVEPFEFAGQRIPGGVPVAYCSWASHRLPEVFPEPDEFRPRRFAPEEKAKLPKGAYVPFGAGSRTCIGMRFGQMEVRTIAALILQRFVLSHRPGYQMAVRLMPTLSPRDGLPMVVSAR
jgi:cytochrome P450